MKKNIFSIIISFLFLFVNSVFAVTSINGSSLEGAANQVYEQGKGAVDKGLNMVPKGIKNEINQQGSQIKSEAKKQGKSFFAKAILFLKKLYQEIINRWQAGVARIKAKLPWL